MGMSSFPILIILGKCIIQNDCFDRYGYKPTFDLMIEIND